MGEGAKFAAEVCVEEGLQTGEGGHAQKEVQGVEGLGEQGFLDVVCEEGFCSGEEGAEEGEEEAWEREVVVSDCG